MRGSWSPNKYCNILTPQLFWLSQPFFAVLLGCSTGGLGAQPLLGHGSHSSIFTPTDLDFLSPGLYNDLTSTYFLRASQPLESQDRPLISSTGCTCYLHRCIFSFDSLAGSEVNMQQVLDYSFDVSKFEIQSCYYVHFRVNTCYSSTRMAVALNNQWRLICD